MTDDTGEELLGRVAAGDRDAFALLYRRYRPDVYRFAAHLCGSPVHAEDVVQDVFLAVIQQARRYRPERSPVRSWLLGIARNYVRRHLSERHTLPLPADDAPSAPAFAVEPDPIAGIARDRQVTAVRRAMLQLPTRYREVIVLCDFHDLPYLDAAVVLDCAVGTVRSRLHRGRALLARRLSEAEQSLTGAMPATRAIL